MRRDMDIVRRILQAVESSDEDPRGVAELDFIDEYPKNVVYYHVQLLHEGGLLVAHNLMGLGPDGYRWMPQRLTPAGHDFLDASREEGIWFEAKKRLEQVGGGSLAILQAVLTQVVKEKLGLLVE